jgi:phage-related protein
MVNKVWVAVVPDTKGFARDVKNYLQRLEKAMRVTVALTVDVDDAAARHKIDDLAGKRTATVNVDADTGLATAQIAALSRRRTVELKAEIQKKSVVAVGAALAALSGARVLQSTFSKLGSTLSNLDRSVPAIAGVGMSVASLGSLALSSVGGIATMVTSLAPLAALAAPLPGLLLAGGAAAGVFAAAMADAGTMLGSLKGGFGALQDSISSEFWAKAKQPILDLVNGVLPSLQTGLSGVASSLGSWSASVAASFQTAFSPSVISGILGPLSTSIGNATAGTGAFASAMATLGTFAAQYLPGIGTMFSNLSISFSNWISGVVGNGQLAGWVQDAVGILQQLGDVAGGALGILGGIASAATAAGGSGLQTLASTLQTISGIVNGPAFQGALTTVFEGAAAGAAHLGTALGPIGSLFQTLAPTISAALSGLSSAASTLVSGIANALNQPVVASGIQAAIAGIMDGVSGLLPALPGLATAFGSLMGVVGQLAGVVGPLLGTALSAIAPVITALAAALGPVIQMLGPMLGTVIAAVTPLLTTLAGVLAPLAQAVMPILAAVLQAVMPLFTALVSVIQPLLPIVTLAAQLLSAVLVPALQLASIPAQGLAKVVATVANIIATAISGVVRVVAALLKGDFSGAWQAAQQTVSRVWSMIQGAVSGGIRAVTSFVSSGVNTVRSVFSSVFGALGGIASSAMSALGSAVSSGISTVISFFSSLPGKILSAVSAFGSLLVSVGRNLMQGFINGVSGFASRMISAVTAPIKGAIDGAKNLLGIHSPSRVFRKIGQYTGQGLEQGLKGSTSGVRSAMRTMTNAVLSEYDRQNRIREQARKTIASLSDGNNPLRKTAAGRAEIARRISAANAEIAGQKFSDSQMNSALRAINLGNERLNKGAERRAKVADRLKAANAALTKATKARDDYKNTVVQGLSKVDVTDSSTTAGIIDQLQRRVSQTKAFTKVMASLRKAGLDDASYKQFIAEGVTSLPLAENLLAGGKGQIKQIASLQGQLAKASGSFAKTASDDLYGAGVNAAKGIVKGLQSQQAAIGKQMQAIAKSMVGSIRKALGIHSPSRVFRDDIGKQVVAGFALGVTSNMKSAHAAIDQLAAYRPTAGYLNPAMARVALPSGSSGQGSSGPAKTYAPVFQYGGERFTEQKFLNAMHQIEVLTG